MNSGVIIITTGIGCLAVIAVLVVAAVFFLYRSPDEARCRADGAGWAAPDD